MIQNHQALHVQAVTIGSSFQQVVYRGVSPRGTLHERLCRPAGNRRVARSSLS
jgi:hypothetical protein